MVLWISYNKIANKTLVNFKSKTFPPHMHMICISLQSFIRRWACICLASPAYAYNTLYTSYRPSYFFFCSYCDVCKPSYESSFQSTKWYEWDDMRRTPFHTRQTKRCGCFSTTKTNRENWRQHDIIPAPCLQISCFTQKQQQKSRANSNAKLSYMKAENVDLNFLSLCWLRDLRFEINLVCHIAVDTQISYKLR